MFNNTKVSQSHETIHNDSDFVQGDSEEMIQLKIKFYLFKKCIEQFPPDCIKPDSTREMFKEVIDRNRNRRNKCYKELCEDFIKEVE
ncbi:MAG: hypothetical protein PH343_07035 [Nitrospira sp.]|nr:hypothetical protein [Nitrospira sp.]